MGDPFARKVLIRENEPPIVIANVVPVKVITDGNAGEGVGGDLHYLFTQASPESIWYIYHGLGKYPSVTCIDSAGRVVNGDITYVDLYRLSVDFGSQNPFSGQAFLN